MKAMPQFPVYVISKGRADVCLTAQFLITDQVPFYLVIEPQEEEAYRAQFVNDKSCTIVILPFSNLGLGSIPARNFCWEHAKESGAKRHWMIDDNISMFDRLHKGKKIRVQAGIALKVVEDFTERYTNIAISGHNYSTFVGLAASGGRMPPFYLNTHVYSCLLILNEIPQRWRGKWNEDTDLNLQVLANKYCTVLFNALSIRKAGTMTMKGGNAAELYKGDGRLEMARSLERAWPGVVETKRRFGRPQHVVSNSWRKFDTPLIRRTDIDWDEIENNAYTLTLRQVADIKSERIQKILDESE